ncbi:MAG: tetratricopeptide repeat protein [Aureispira sp.]|nr:tetratricopeptide repeat protein [Aureispira sp.]
MRIFTYTCLILLVSSQLLLAQSADAIKEYNAGLQYYNVRNYKTALPFFEAAVKKDKSFLYAYRVLISCHEQLDEVDKAIPYYEKVIELDPSDKKVVYNFALVYLTKKDYNKCRLYLKKALAIDATYSKASDKLKEIDAYVEKQNKKNSGLSEVQTVEVDDKKSMANRIYNEALEEYKNENYDNALSILRGFSGEVTNANFYYLKAITYQHLGKRDDAIEAYLETIEFDDRHFDANLGLGTIYYNDKNFEEAALHLETAFERRKNDRKLLFSLAKAYYFAKSYKEAIPFLEQYSQYDTKNAEVWYYLGESYSKVKLGKKAEKAYAKAKELTGGKGDPINAKIQNSVASYGNKAREETKNGNYDQAIAILEQAITEHSEEASLHFNLGLNYMEVGNVKKAREEFKKTIDLESDHAKAYQALAMIYYDREDFSEAAAYYLATIDAGKQDEFVHYKLGSCYFKLKRFNQAIVEFNKAIKMNSQEKYFFFSLGLAYLYNKENLKSIEALEGALKLDPTFLDAKYHVCVNYIDMSQYDKCIAEGEKIIELNNKYAKAYLVIGHAYKRKGQYDVAEKYQNEAERLDPSLRD